MSELREKIARMAAAWDDDGAIGAFDFADAILAIPDIKCALGLLERRQYELDDPKPRPRLND